MAEVSVQERSGLVDPGTPSAEPFRTLRLALQLRSDQRTGNIIVITSAVPEEGKSTVAANYALISALSHGRVLLVDGDLRKPALHEVFGVDRSPGLVELLAREADLREFVHRISGAGMLDLLPAGRAVPRSADLASSPRMAELLRQAAKQYKLVVIDAPPLLSAADAEALASHPGVSVLVVARRNGRKRPLIKTLRRLELVEADVAGIVVNRDGRAVAYGY